jgi:hypothetical protein
MKNTEQTRMKFVKKVYNGLDCAYDNLGSVALDLATLITELDDPYEAEAAQRMLDDVDELVNAVGKVSDALEEYFEV